MQRPLEPAGDELRTLLAAAVDYVVGVVDRLPAAPVADTDGVAELLADPTVRAAPPARGRSLTELLGVLDRAAAKGVNPGNPRLMALTVLDAPELSTVAFRHRAGDEITAAVLDRVNAERRVFLSSTRVNGQYTARICVLNHRTDHTRVAEAVAAIRRHAAQVTAAIPVLVR
jgi:hypothetical protein